MIRTLCLIMCLATSAFADAPKPNIVFILADDLGPGDLGCYGGKIAATPNIDRMAKEGMRFTQYYAAAPICSPSRCGLITGNFPARWRITSFLQTRAGNAGCGQADYLDAKAPSLPRALQAAGYRTAHFGKWHLGGGRDVKDMPKFAAYGYDAHAGTWESPEPHPDITATDWIWSDKDKVKRWDRTAFFVDKTLEFLKARGDKPCFVNLWLDDPHTPWVPNATQGKGKEANTRPNLKAVMEENDKQVGRLLEGIKALGIDKETLVIFASDNGPMPTLKGDRSAGLRGSKMSLYEGGIRLPFIARWPGHVPEGKVDETTILAAVDMFPTFCAFAGAVSPKETDGEERSFALLGTPMKDRAKPLFWEYGRNDEFFKYPGVKGDRSPAIACREGKWKLLVNADGSSVELYDLQSDPAEQKNLAVEQPEKTAKLKTASLEWWKGVPK